MELLSVENFFTLWMLIFLQVVLGFDNLLYISLESSRVEPNKQARLRKLGIGIAVVLRIVLLFVVIKVISLFQNTLFGVQLQGFVEASFNLHSLIVLLGGIFILYTALKEITHMMVLEDAVGHKRKPRTFLKSLFWIIIMNLVFSFDSILGAMALCDQFIIMAIAIIMGGILMIYLADNVTEFLKKNRMYEVVGLFVLLLVGVMLISEGGHLAHLKLFGFSVEAMSKTTFYFVIFIMVVIDLVQSRYQKKLLEMSAEK